MLRQPEPRKERKGRKTERKGKEEIKGRGCGVGAKLPSPSCGSYPAGWCCMAAKTCAQGAARGACAAGRGVHTSAREPSDRQGSGQGFSHLDATRQASTGSIYFVALVSNGIR